MKPAVVHGLEGNPATQGISRSLDSRNVLAAFPLHVLLAAGYRFKIVTDPDDLSHAIQQALKVRHHDRGKLDRPLFSVHVGPMARWDKPVLIAIDPDVELVFDQDVDHGLYRLVGEQVFADDGKIGPHEQAAIKCRDRVLKAKIVDQHLHASWRPAAGDCKSDSRANDLLNGGTRPCCQNFIGSNQCTVNIRYHQAYIFRHFFFAYHRTHLAPIPLGSVTD